MSNTPEVYWPGKSGREYGYWVNRIGTNYVSQPGNYIYAKSVNGFWEAVYIGETSNLANRLGNHEKERCAIANGATHVHAHTSSANENERRAEEVDLITKWEPACNVQHVRVRF